MTLRLVDRLNAARRRFFVGRSTELALLQSALTAPDWPFQVLYLHGPGGVGKTTLLNEYLRLATAAQVPSVYLDTRNIEPVAESLLTALRQALNLSGAQSPLAHLAAQPQRHLILLDTGETLAPLMDWLTETFLPELPVTVLLVLASRESPPEAWRTDPGWQSLIRFVPLRNLSLKESRAYLIQHDLPAAQFEAVLNFTHGHPLALSLVADAFHQRSEPAAFQPENTPDIVRTLLERFVQKVPGPAHRAALEACSLVRVATEGLLAHMLGTPDARELFDWLRGLSFIEAGPQGVFPHDLAREALATDMRWPPICAGATRTGTQSCTGAHVTTT